MPDRHRPEDKGDLPIIRTFQVSVAHVGALAGTILVAAFGLWISDRDAAADQAKQVALLVQKMEVQVDQVRDLSGDVKLLTRSMNEKSIKDSEQDGKLADISGRLRAIEAVRMGAGAR